MKKLICLAIALAAITLPSAAGNARDAVKEIPERAGGVYYAYPVDGAVVDLGSIKGYEPFYISHYGRHGSRYLISDNDYERIINRLNDAHKAGALTPAGEKLRLQLDTIWEDARGRGGELSPLGARQHRGIARRMATAYPAVFAKGAEVTATSTPVMRCAHSMFHFINGLKDLNPTLDVPVESSLRHKIYLSYQSPESGAFDRNDGPWYQDYTRFKNSHTNPDRLISTIFADKHYVDMWVDQDAFMWDLYWVAVDQQSLDNGVDLMPYLTNDELYALWEVANFGFFARNSSYIRANGLHTDNAKNLLRHIIENSDAYIADGRHGATLRFGHDGNIIPLLALLKVEGCYSDAERPEDLSAEYADFYVCPMGTNLQFIFFRPTKGKGDLLVRVLHNEQPAVMPVANAGEKGLYRWNDLRPYLTSLAYAEK